MSVRLNITMDEVVSNDSCNTHGRRVVVLPITSNIDTLYPARQ